MKAVKTDDSIECLSAEIISRDFRSGALVSIPILGRCRIYNCKRNSEAKILKELGDKERDKKYANSMVNIGDAVEGENITVYIKTVKPLKIEIVNHSGRHKAQRATTNDYTYAKIALQFHGLPSNNQKNLKK